MLLGRRAATRHPFSFAEMGREDDLASPTGFEPSRWHRPFARCYAAFTYEMHDITIPHERLTNGA